MRSLLAKSAVLATAIAISLLLGEAIVRWIESSTRASKVEYLTAYDPLLGWSKGPNRSVENRTREFDVIESTNSRGLRGPEASFEKALGSYRVLMLGDSFLEGYTVNFEDVVSEKVRERLEMRLDVPVDVVNGGTAGYSTDQELLFYRHEGRRYRADAVVLLFYVNDVWFNGSTRYWRGFKPRFVLEKGALKLTGSPVPAPGPSQFAYAVAGGSGLARLARASDAALGGRSALYRLARNAIADSPVTRRWLISSGLAEVPGEWMPWKKDPPTQVEEAWTLTELLLRKLRDEVEADGAALTVFYVPSRPAVYDADWEQVRHAYAMNAEEWSPTQDAKLLADICAAGNLDCLIPIEEFRTEAAKLEARGESLYFHDDAHWTPQGHALAGWLIADHLAQKR